MGALAEIGVADHLPSEETRTVGELASQCKVSPSALRRSLRLLCARGIFSLEAKIACDNATDIQMITVFDGARERTREEFEALCQQARLKADQSNFGRSDHLHYRDRAFILVRPTAICHRLTAWTNALSR